MKKLRAGQVLLDLQANKLKLGDKVYWFKKKNYYRVVYSTSCKKFGIEHLAFLDNDAKDTWITTKPCLKMYFKKVKLNDIIKIGI